MIQAFVSLKPHQPARTEPGMRSFFEALQSAVFSRPTVFRSNADESVRPYSLDDVVSAALDPRCRFVVLRAECEKFWQCTFLLPDKQGMGALFFDLQRMQNPRRLSPDVLIEMFKSLYHSLSPRLIRVGDSEAREKLRSRHGLVMMPGLGRIEWLQIVSPSVYADIYNPSELVAAPGYASEIWEDGALFMRVYDDPNDWDSEDNISQANFIPGFLAGVAKIKDSEKEKETIREVERLWSRAEKTAEKAYEVLSADPNNVAVESAPKAQSAPVEEIKLLEGTADLDSDDAKKRDVVCTRLKSEFTIEESDIEKCATEGPCTIFKCKPSNKNAFYASYQDEGRKVFILNSLEDLSGFLKLNGCSVKPECFDTIKRLLKTYYHPDYRMIDSLDELPEDVRNDRRMPEMRKLFKPAAVETVNGNQCLEFWFYKIEAKGLETLSFTQFEDWPMQLDAKVQCTDMESEPEAPAEPAKPEKAAEPEKSEELSKPAVAEIVSQEPAKEDKEVVFNSTSGGGIAEAGVQNTQMTGAKRRKASAAAAEPQVPMVQSQGASKNKIIIVGVVFVVIIIVLLGLYFGGMLGGK